MAKIEQRQELKQKLSPRQILQAKLFQLNSFSLEQAIYQELEKNPLLELSEIVDKDLDYDEEKNDEQVDDFELDELYSNTDDFELQRNDKQSFENFSENRNDLVSSLKNQLSDLNLTEVDEKIALEIIGNLDVKGYLSMDIFLIADRYNVNPDKVKYVKDKIRLLDPPGVASLNIRECLISQLVFHNFKDSYAYQMIDQYFEDFSNASYDKIQKNLKISKNEIKESLDIISNLNLYPGYGIEDFGKGTIIPDLMMDKREGQWIVSLNDSSIPELILNSKYSDMINDKKTISKTKTFIKSNYNKATLFLDAIKERKKTMLLVMHAIIDSQTNFFNSDKKELKPMLIKDVAKSTGFDNSTISRICNGKYVQLPWGLFELRSFFSEGIKMKDGAIISNTILKADIVEIIKNEPLKDPLRDEDIMKILDKKGYQVARRTITKYRELLNIPNSIMRKKIKGL